MHARFDYFSQLPAELRLEIWKASLPSRVIPIESRRPCPGPSDDRIKRAWQRPPTISRVCREARRVALQHGVLRWAEHPVGGKRWFKTWINPTTDLVLIDTSTDLLDISKDILADHVLVAAQKARAVVISWNYINLHHIADTERLLDFLGRPLVFIANNYILHMTERQAMDTGLFGSEAEQTTVLVDAEDKHRLRAFAALCSQAESNLHVLENHLESLEDPSVPEFKSFSSTVRDEFIRIWLRLDRHGIPKWRDAKDDPRFETLYNRFGGLNRDHALVKKAIESMPKYKPIFSFQRCLNSQHLLI